MLLVTLQASGLNSGTRASPAGTVTNRSVRSARVPSNRRRESDTGLGHGIVVRARNGTQMVTLNHNGAMTISAATAVSATVEQ